MSVEYTIVCDGCASVLSASARSAAEARRIVREDMGGTTSLSGGRDLCSACSSDGSGSAS